MSGRMCRIQAALSCVQYQIDHATRGEFDLSSCLRGCNRVGSSTALFGEHGIYCANRRAAEAVSFSLCWQTLGHRARAPSEQEAKHVGEVVTRVCDQRQRMSEKSENRFKDDVAGVQRNADCKGDIEIRRGMRVADVGMGVFVSHTLLS